MGLSTIVDWLNENEQRAYPLTTDSPATIEANGTLVNFHKVVLDANIVFIEDDMPAEVKLEKVTSNGTDVTLYVSGANSETFLVTGVNSATYPVYVRNGQGSLLVLGEELKACLTAANPSLELSDVKFEPTVASEFRGRLRGVTSLAFNGVTLVGPVDLKEGYQTGIEFRDGNILYLAASPSEGIPLDCRNFFENELDYDCADIVSWINGATPTDNGGKLRLIAGRNVRIFEDKENSKIYIGLDFDDGDICPVPNLPPK